ncbi:MAG: D-alanine aminotransferase [Chlamydiia bacterium]|nr:D-alanine aminotransferase [Chlamydiia bacterium]
MDIIYVRGEFVKRCEALIPIDDLGFLRAHGVFEVFRTYDQLPFHMETHFDRLFASAQKLNIQVPYSRNQLASIIDELIARNSHRTEHVFRLILTSGNTKNSFDPIPSTPPSLYIICEALHNIPSRFYASGIRLMTYPFLRPFPLCKTIGYTFAVTGVLEAKQANADDILYTHQETLLECSTSNFFCVIDGVLYTANAYVLPGITREVTLDLAKQMGLEVSFAPVRVEQIPTITEAFITSSLKEIMPVGQIDQYLIDSNGPITCQLKTLFMKRSHPAFI